MKDNFSFLCVSVWFHVIKSEFIVINKFKILVVFSPIFVADIKIISIYNFLALLKISQNPLENNCARASFLRKMQDQAFNFLKKRDSGTGVFLWILKWNTSGGCFWFLSKLPRRNDTSFTQIALIGTSYSSPLIGKI